MGLYQNSYLLWWLSFCVIVFAFTGLACGSDGNMQNIDEELVLNRTDLRENEIDNTLPKIGKGVGDRAPHFRLELVNGTVVELPGLLTHGPVILYFFTAG